MVSRPRRELEFQRAWMKRPPDMFPSLDSSFQLMLKDSKCTVLSPGIPNVGLRLACPIFRHLDGVAVIEHVRCIVDVHACVRPEHGGVAVVQVGSRGVSAAFTIEDVLHALVLNGCTSMEMVRACW